MLRIFPHKILRLSQRGIKGDFPPGLDIDFRHTEETAIALIQAFDLDLNFGFCNLDFYRYSLGSVISPRMAEAAAVAGLPR